jgi:hypothetical protein
MSGSDYHGNGQLYTKKKILHLVLKAKYFHRIYNKTKRVEYRDFSKYWSKRIEGKNYTHIKFQLAYSKNPPTMLVKIHDLNVIRYKNELAFAFDLGLISEVNNYRPPTDTDYETT